ncbi:anthranilate phosphoribosyltransferase [Anaerotalea alkaliphila]|uniref:Anthranilate phosphoribosyltransferase n=1 Tax=Anaerotalea alkaliphila TaxID=2662126 RepID=A0A7X5KP91_9FIRM|nr:anthranilate phosphoribosyltransferase [Anaerotalea alkaliphila]NDL67727.1 anthranilate phosphoribosyltransferase [Anaerotalea alkaliphila]
MIHENIQKMMAGNNLTEEEMLETMTKIMSGEVTESQMASFLTALKMKGESVSEIVGGARAMRGKADRLELQNYYTVDTCGTGGDHFGTFNISTATAIVAAAAGIKVVKHGNRSVSSKSGSADVLEALGVKIDLTKEQVARCLEETGIGFFFAPIFHQAMKHVGKTRKELGFRTIFNILGPLANPANANAQVLGVFDGALLEPMANVLLNLGVERALVVHGQEGLDELSISADTEVVEIKDGKLHRYTLRPEDFGIRRVGIDEIKGGDSQENARIIRDLLEGMQGPKRDVLLLNAAAALYVGKKADSLQEGMGMAASLIDSGQAARKLEEFIAASNRV